MPSPEHSDQVKTRTSKKTEIDPPKRYRVILLNDDYTTFDFVVKVLVNIFKKPVADAVKITNDVHKKGSGTCGIYPRDIAETKVEMVNSAGKEAGFPLRCEMEEE